MTADSQTCERAREWASLRADAELSELESALLDVHLGRCLPCRSFAGGAEEVAAALRAARLERPAPVALVLPRRPAMQALEALIATTLITAGAAAAAVIGFDRPAPAPRAAPVAILAAGDAPDVLRELRRAMLVTPGRSVPRNRSLPDESAYLP